MVPFKNFLTEFSNLDSEVKRILSDFFSNENPLLMVTETHWRPNTDIYETPKGIIIKIEIAGVKQEDLNITYENDMLIIKGRRPDYSVPDRILCRQVEINYGEFEKIVSFEKYTDKSIDADNIKATYKDGMLFIFVPYLKKIEPVKTVIKINIEGE